MNFGKGEYITMDMRGAHDADITLEILNDRAKEGLFFCGITPSGMGHTFDAIFWKPKIFWFKPSEKMPDNDSEVLVVMDRNKKSIQNAHYINEEWVCPDVPLGVCFVEKKIIKWSYYDES